MSLVPAIRRHLQHLAASSEPIKAVFFKTGVGEYAEHDQFMGLRVPLLRNCLKLFPHVTHSDIQELLTSPINEERLLALMVMVKGYPHDPEAIYAMYRQYIEHVNNWNLVDVSAHHIVGAYAWTNRQRSILDDLVASPHMWQRRIAIVATWHTIAKGESEWTLHMAERLLKDTHDLIHKATGWMLREMGKKNLPALLGFLDQHAPIMPRTMLRYALEKLPADQKKAYMKA